MKVVTTEQFRSKFTHFVQRVLKGEEIWVSYGRGGSKVFKVSPVTIPKKQRKLGGLEGKVRARFDKWEITDDELVSL